MKKRILLTTILAVLLGMPCRHVVAQTEVRYPNPAYLHREVPCPEIFGYNWSYLGIYPFPMAGFYPDYIAENDVCFVNPFGKDEEKQTVHGVALCVIPYSSHLPPYLLMDRRITLDIMLYQFVPGDSNVHLIKSQTFVVEENQRPDLVLVYREKDNLDGYYNGIDSLVRFPMYEFYFDYPQEVEGNFYVGVHSVDSFLMPMPQHRTLPSCCHNGYWGVVNVNNSMLIRYTNESFVCNHYQGEGRGETHGVTAPWTDTMYTGTGQMVYPITKPQGYLTATEPTAEAAGGRVRLSPNPARTRVTVEADCGIRHVEVADMAGRVLVSERYDAGARSATLDVGRFAQGIYAVRVYTEREEAVQKLIIE